MSKTNCLPTHPRSSPADHWDLSTLFKADDEWETAFKKWEAEIDGYTAVRRHARRQRRPDWPRASKFDTDFDRAGERLGTYAYLKTAEDQQQQLPADDGPLPQRRHARPARRPATSGRRSWRFPRRRSSKFLAAEELAALPTRARADPALQAAHALARRKKSCSPCRARWPRPSNQVFRQLNDADLKFGIRQEREGRAESSCATRRSRRSCTRPSATVRKTAFHQYYDAVPGPREHAGRDAHRLDPARRVLRQGPRLSDGARRRRCSPTTCRCRSTTT